MTGLTAAMDIVTPPDSESVSRLDQLLGSENVQFVVSSLLAVGSVINSAGTPADGQESPLVEAQDSVSFYH